jgi:hypothetical protein
MDELGRIRAMFTTGNCRGKPYKSSSRESLSLQGKLTFWKKGDDTKVVLSQQTKWIGRKTIK